MNAQVWVQALSLGSGLAALGWALTGGPLRISKRASRHFVGFNALVLLGSLAWWTGPWHAFMPAAYWLTLGLVIVLAALQWLCVGLHRLHDIKASYVVSPFMLPFLAVLMAVIAWLDASGSGALLACFSASLWMLGVTVQQGFPAMSAQAGKNVARWALVPFSAAVVVWMVGMGRTVWYLAAGPSETETGVQVLPVLADAISLLLGWALVNGGLVCRPASS